MDREGELEELQEVAKQSTDGSAPPEWLLSNIADATKSAKRIYLVYLGLVAYCAITVVTTTDRQLVLKHIVNLPLMNVQAPLVGFFAATPILILLVYLYLLLLLTHRKDLIIELMSRHPNVVRERLYPSFLLALDFPKKGFVGTVESLCAHSSVWYSFPLALMVFSTFIIKKHDAYLSYIMGLSPILGLGLVTMFWYNYNTVKFRKKLPRMIWGLLVMACVLVYQGSLLFYIIPNAN